MSMFGSILSTMFTGGWYNLIKSLIGYGNSGHDLGTFADRLGHELGDMSEQEYLSNFFAKTTGSSLTAAEREANAWNEQQVLSAWNRQMEADNTKYQRQVADMQAAGLNPMLAAGGTLHSPTAAVASSVSPSAAAFNIGDLISLFKMKADIKNIEADTASKQASAAKDSASAVGQEIINNYEEERQRLYNEGLGIANSLSRAKIDEINKQIEDYDSQISLRLKQENSEEARANLIGAQSLLARASAYQIAELIPYSKALMSAQTDQAKQAAAFAAAQAAYQNGLLSSGMIEAQVYKLVAEKKNLSASQKYAETKASVLNIEKSLKEGHNPENWSPDSISGALVGTLYNLLETINPLSKLGL